MKQIVISEGYGAGWCSWAGIKKAQAIAEYQPIVDYVASGLPTLSGEPRPYIPSDNWESTSFDEREAWLHPDFRKLVAQMMVDLDLDYFFTGGADGLTVVSVAGSYRVDEYDGYESVTTAEELWS